MSEEIWKDFPEVKGKKIESVSGLEVGSGSIFIKFEDGDRLVLYHPQECCEHVRVEDCEDITPNELEGCVIHSFEEYVKSSDGWMGSTKYTFYKLITNNVDCTIRFLGESNGYYGVSVRVRLEIMGGKDKVLSDE